MAGKHRLIKRKNWTLRATLAAAVGLAALAIMGMSAGPDVTPQAPAVTPIAEAVRAWDNAVQIIEDVTPAATGNTAEADSAAQVAVATRKAHPFHLPEE